MMNFLENNYLKNNFSKSFQKTTPRPKIDLGDKPRKIWVKKSEFKCLVSFTCLRTCATNSQYFDCRCSRHMIRDKNILVDYKPLSEGLVTFGDGVTIRVLSRGNLNIDCFPRFKNVLHVDGLKDNLISIGQICDLNLNVIVRNVLFLILMVSMFWKVFVQWVIVTHLLHFHTRVTK